MGIWTDFCIGLTQSTMCNVPPLQSLQKSLRCGLNRIHGFVHPTKSSSNQLSPRSPSCEEGPHTRPLAFLSPKHRPGQRANDLDAPFRQPLVREGAYIFAWLGIRTKRYHLTSGHGRIPRLSGASALVSQHSQSFARRLHTGCQSRRHVENLGYLPASPPSRIHAFMQ